VRRTVQPPRRKAYNLRSYALGHSGDFALVPIEDTLVEVGDRVVTGREPLRVFEMRLKRIGDTEWPAANPVSPK
jgi:hypothetical protein